MRSAWQGQPAYSWFVLAAFVFHWGLYTAIPLFPIYWVRELHLSDAWVGVLSLCMSATSVAGALVAPALMRRWGHRRLLIYAAPVLALYPLGTALSRSPYPLLLATTVGGFVSALMGVSFFNRLIEVVPPARRASYVGLHSAIINVAVFAAPLVSTTLAGPLGVGTMLFVAGGVRVLGGLLFALSRGEASELPDSSPMGKQVAESPGGTS